MSGLIPRRPRNNQIPQASANGGELKGNSGEFASIALLAPALIYIL